MKKEPIIPERIRRLPKAGWSWIDRRFLREHASSLGRDATFLYFFLAAVSDKHGMSFWSDAAVAVRLRISEENVVKAREELELYDLITYDSPLYQVLSLPERYPPRRGSTGAPTLLGELMRKMAFDDAIPQERTKRSPRRPQRGQ